MGDYCQKYSNNPLEEARYNYPLKVHRGISHKIIQHNHARSFYAWLELKPLFGSGQIFYDEEVEGLKTSVPKIPHRKIAAFLKMSVRCWQYHYTILKKYKLLSVDGYKNINLASYKTFAEILKHNDRKKYSLPNEGETQFLLKKIAVFDNLAKQDYKKRQKMFHAELFEILFERNRNLLNKHKSFIDPTPITDEILSALSKDKKRCTKFFSKAELRKLRKHFNDHHEQYHLKYKKKFNSEVQQISFGRPEINMQITLSQQGLSNLFGRGSNSTGSYQKKLLIEKKMLYAEGEYQFIPDQSPAIAEGTEQLYPNEDGKFVWWKMRNDIFSYNYKYKRKIDSTKKYFRRCPDTIRPIFADTFEDNFKWSEAKLRVIMFPEQVKTLFGEKKILSSYCEDTNKIEAILAI